MTSEELRARAIELDERAQDALREIEQDLERVLREGPVLLKLKASGKSRSKRRRWRSRPTEIARLLEAWFDAGPLERKHLAERFAEEGYTLLEKGETT